MDWSAAANLFLLLSAPFIGSFINVLADRWATGQPFVRGRSHCEHCGHVLGWRDLIPVLSWILADGKCRYCRACISVRHPAVELFALGIAVWSYLWLQEPVSWISSIFGWVLLTLAIIDFRWFWLPNALTLPLALAGLLVTWMIRPSNLLDHAIGAVTGYVVLATVAWAYRRYRGQEGLGEGDPRLFAAIGAWVGWQGLGTVLLYAGIAGLLSLLIRTRAGDPIQATTRLSFGSYLCLGAWLVWLYGPLYVEP